MKVSSFLVLVIGAVFVFSPLSLAATNHTENILDIHTLLDLIEQRVQSALEDKEYHVSIAKSSLSSDLKEKQQFYDQAKEDMIKEQTKVHTKYQDAKQAAENEYDLEKQSAKNLYEQAKQTAHERYQSKLNDADIIFEQGLESIQQMQQQYNASAEALQSFQEHYETKQQQLEHDLTKFRQHMEAELQLVAKIRNLLDSMHSRSIKGVLEHCDTNYGCLNHLECVQGSCRAPTGEMCSSTEECKAGNSCVSSRCVESRSCATILAGSSSAPSGTYTLQNETGELYQAYCDMETEGGGWTLVVSAVDRSYWNSGGVGGTLPASGHPDEWRYTKDDIHGSVSGFKFGDYKGISYSTVPFTE